MDFLKINSSKIKITLTKEECERYGICETDGEFESHRVREVISDILEESELGASFSKPREKLLVQLYPARDGGAEVFITKLSFVGEREQRAISKSENVSTYKREESIFLFESFADLLAASRIMKSRKKRADLYLRHDGKYLIIINEELLNGMSDCDVLSEFATKLSAQSYTPIPEWDRLLAAGDAFDRLGNL